MGLCNISRGKAKVLQQKQLSQETFRNLTPSRRSERIKSGRIVKPKICKIKKPKIGIKNFKNYIYFFLKKENIYV